MNCKYYCDRFLGWVLNNKVIVFLSLLCFCLFVSTLALAGQKNRLSAELSDLTSTTTTTTTQIPETGDNNTGGDDSEGEENNAGGENNEGEENNAGGDDKEGNENNPGAGDNEGEENNPGNKDEDEELQTSTTTTSTTQIPETDDNNKEGDKGSEGGDDNGKGTGNDESPNPESASNLTGKEDNQQVVSNTESVATEKPAEEQVLSGSRRNFELDSKLLQMLAGGA